MKKLFFILMAVMSFISIEAFAQEVRGVETKVSIYYGPQYKGGRTWAAYAFTNANTFPVFVDAELYRSKASDSFMYNRVVSTAYAGTIIDQSFPMLISTKSFVLNPGETYLWKHEQEYDPLPLNDERYEYYEHYCFRSGSESWGNADKYFVKYKAYKLQ